MCAEEKGPIFLTLAFKLSTFRETLIVVIGVQLKMYTFYIIKLYWGDLHIYLVV
jgi:hypothetical protein